MSEAYGLISKTQGLIPRRFDTIGKRDIIISKKLILRLSPPSPQRGEGKGEGGTKG